MQPWVGVQNTMVYQETRRYMIENRRKSENAVLYGFVMFRELTQSWI